MYLAHINGIFFRSFGGLPWVEQIQVNGLEIRFRFQRGKRLEIYYLEGNLIGSV